MRPGSCCWMPPENSQFDGRCPHPVRRSGSKSTAAFAPPKVLFAIALQLSPPLPARFCAAGFARLQSTAKFPLESAQLRVVVVCSVLIGFGALPRPLSGCPSRYLFAANLIDV